MPPSIAERQIVVLLVDDHALVRRGFRRVLEDDPDILVMGEAGDGQDAIDMALRLRPDVMVMDYALPTMNGDEATRKIVAALPKTAVLILSMHPETTYVKRCLDAGAHGYLLKNAMDLELVDAVKRLAQGGRLLDPRLALNINDNLEHRTLTPRELEVLQWIVQGKSNKDIAQVLGVSVNTISVHRASIMQRLEVNNTAELVVSAIRSGLVSIA